MGRVFIVNGAPGVAVDVTASCHNLLIHAEDYNGYLNTLSAVFAVEWDVLVICATGNTKEVIELCGAVRTQKALCQIIIAFDNHNDASVADCLTYGADDFVAAPFNSIVFTARVFSALRRAKKINGLVVKARANTVRPTSSINSNGIDSDAPCAATHQNVDDAGFTLCPVTKKAIIAGESVSLTKSELMLLSYLVSNKNRPCSKFELLNDVLGYKDECYLPSLYSHMNRLRRKFKQKNLTSTRVETIWRFGYRIVFEN